MKTQELLNRRVNDKARAAVRAGAIHKLSEKALSFRMPSFSKPGGWHDTFLRWELSEDGKVAGLRASCAWIEPVTNSQTHCPGNNSHTICWHVAAAIIAAAGNSKKRVAFFTNRASAKRYSNFGGCVIPILGHGVWFVVNGSG